MAECGAKTRSGGRCRRAGTGVGGRCKLHGGATPVGPAAAAWKHGRYSEYFIGELGARYAAARNNKDLVALRDEIALVDVRISQLVEAWGAHPPTAVVRAIRTRLEAFKALGAKGDGQGAALRTALQALEEEIADAERAAANWDELREWIEQRRKLVEAEVKRAQVVGEFVTAQQALSVMERLIHEIKRVVPDPAVTAHLAAFCVQLAGAPDGGAAAAAGDRA